MDLHTISELLPSHNSHPLAWLVFFAGAYAAAHCLVCVFASAICFATDLLIGRSRSMASAADFVMERSAPLVFHREDDVREDDAESPPRHRDSGRAESENRPAPPKRRPETDAARLEREALLRAMCTEMSHPASDPFATFENLENLSWFDGLLRGLREKQIARNEERLLEGRKRRLRVRLEVAEASLPMYEASLEVQGAATRATVGAHILDTVRDDPGRFSPPPIGAAPLPTGNSNIPSFPKQPQQTTPHFSQPVAPPVQRALPSETVRRMVMEALALNGSNDAAWMKWAARMYDEYPADADTLVETAARTRRLGNLQGAVD
jgi:hypothetical protein